MRTATTLAITHDGKPVLVAHPDLIGVVEQAQAFRQLLGKPTHPEYAKLSYQESDGQPRIIKFNKPDKPDKPAEPREPRETKVSRKTL